MLDKKRDESAGSFPQGRNCLELLNSIRDGGDVEVAQGILEKGLVFGGDDSKGAFIAWLWKKVFAIEDDFLRRGYQQLFIDKGNKFIPGFELSAEEIKSRIYKYRKSELADDKHSVADEWYMKYISAVEKNQEPPLQKTPINYTQWECALLKAVRKNDLKMCEYLLNKTNNQYVLDAAKACFYNNGTGLIYYSLLNMKEPHARVVISINSIDRLSDSDEGEFDEGEFDEGEFDARDKLNEKVIKVTGNRVPREYGREYDAACFTYDELVETLEFLLIDKSLVKWKSKMKDKLLEDIKATRDKSDKLAIKDCTSWISLIRQVSGFAKNTSDVKPSVETANSLGVVARLSDVLRKLILSEQGTALEIVNLLRSSVPLAGLTRHPADVGMPDSMSCTLFYDGYRLGCFSNLESSQEFACLKKLMQSFDAEHYTRLSSGRANITGSHSAVKTNLQAGGSLFSPAGSGAGDDHHSGDEVRPVEGAYAIF